MKKSTKKPPVLSPITILIGLTVLVLSFLLLNGVINNQNKTIEKEDAQKISNQLEIEENNKEVSEQMTTAFESPAPVQSVPDCDTQQDWKNYSNKKYGFCFSYSPNLILSNQSNDDFVSLLERQNNGQDSILAQRVGIFIKDDQSGITLEDFVKNDAVATGEDVDPDFENSTLSGNPAIIVKKNPEAQTQFGIRPEDIKQVVKAVYVKNADAIIAIYPTDSVETQKTDWFTPVLKTLRFSQ